MSKLDTSDNQGRICSACEIFKSWESFDKKSTGINGRHNCCKACIKIKKRKWWRKKNARKISCPEVLIYSSSDLESIELPLLERERKDLENTFRQLIFKAIINGKERKS